MDYLTHDPIDVAAWHRQTVDSRDGASVEFLGIARGQEDGQPVDHLTYEAYEPMANRMIADLVEQAEARWPLHRVYVQHRIGRVAVGEIAVLIGVQGPHREEVFEACRFLIDGIKRDAPIWKAAVGSDGAIIEAMCTHGHRTR